ncbi:hypothetical protein ID853_02715 [Xenorhabdus sp. Vera]|nr:hypothetical protein [Xenorhabdus sp. Vera]
MKLTRGGFLLAIKSVNVAFWCTYSFKYYNMLPKNKHLIGKSSTQRVERENLILHNRKAIEP